MRIDCAVRHSRRDRRSAHRAEQPSLKRLDVRRIGADQIGNAARQDVAEDSEAAPQHGFRLRTATQSPFAVEGWRAAWREQIAEISLNRGVQRLIDIMRDRIERAGETGNLIVRIQGIGVVGVAQTEGPGQLRGHSPGVLRVEIKIQKVERFDSALRETSRVAVDATP